MNKMILIAACATLSACDMPAFNLSLPNLGDATSETEAVVTRDEITLVGPRGFCVDPQSSNRDALSAFIVFGNCAAITDSNTAPQPMSNAIVTSAVQMADPALPRINASGAQLSQFFDSDVGHILLSRDNDPTSVDVIESGVTANGAFFVYVMDTGEGAPDGTEDTYWRAYLDAKNSVVTLSVLSLEANPLTKDEGLDILRDFTNAILSVPSNAITGSAQITAPDVLPTTQENGITKPVARPVLGTGPAIEPVIEPKKTRIGLLDRLFG